MEITKENVGEGLEHSEWHVRADAIGHPFATSQHIDKALSDDNWFVYSKAIRHHNINAENINYGLTRENSYLRRRILDKILDRGNDKWRY